MSKQYQMVGIIGAMEPEIALLKDHMDSPIAHQIGNIIIYEGVINTKKIALCLSGIGKVNAAIATTLLINRFGCQAIINTGSAGGLGQDLAVGDVVIGDKIAHHDVDVRAFGYHIGQVPQLPAYFVSDAMLMDIAQSAITSSLDDKDLRVWQGLIVSGDAFVHSDKQIKTIRDHFPEVVAVEMEAAAIAQSCHQLQTPFVIVRAVSDNGDETAALSFEEFLQTAAQNSAKMVLGLIGKL